MRAISAKQGNRTVTKYANELKGLWQELDHNKQIEIKCTDDAATLKKITQCDRTYGFLTGINQECRSFVKENSQPLTQSYLLSLLKKAGGL